MLKLIKLFIIPIILSASFLSMVSSANADETKTTTNVTIIKKDANRHIIEAKTLDDQEIILHTIMPNQNSLLKEKSSYLITYDGNYNIMQIKKIHNINQKNHDVSGVILLLLYAAIIILVLSIMHASKLFSQKQN